MNVSAADRAEVSVILTAYQSERFIAEAVRSVLAQTGVVADILLSDDASTDQTYAILAGLAAGYVGPHTVRVRRNAENVGPDHGLGLVDLARADVIVMAHADDVAEPNRCRRLLDEMNGCGADAATSNFLEIEADGQPLGLHLQQAATHCLSAEEIVRTGWQPALVGSTLAFRRRVLAAFEPFSLRHLGSGHDTLLPFRAALLGGVRYVHEPLVRRRRHAGQASAAMHHAASPDMYAESNLGFAVKLYAGMARDVRWLLRSPVGAPDQTRLESVQRQIDARLLELIDDWMTARAALAEQGLHPDWVSRETYEALARQTSRPALREWARRWYRRWRWQLFRR